MNVVAGVIYQKKRILLARRSSLKDRAGKWEFPGGKIEPHEAPEQALARELKEELKIQTQPSQMKYLGEVVKDDIHLKIYTLPLESSYSPREHDAVAWVTRLDAPHFKLCESDQKAIEALKIPIETFLKDSE